MPKKNGLNLDEIKNFHFKHKTPQSEGEKKEETSNSQNPEPKNFGVVLKPAGSTKTTEQEPAKELSEFEKKAQERNKQLNIKAMEAQIDQEEKQPQPENSSTSSQVLPITSQNSLSEQISQEPPLLIQEHKPEEYPPQKPEPENNPHIFSGRSYYTSRFVKWTPQPRLSTRNTSFSRARKEADFSCRKI